MGAWFANVHIFSGGESQSALVAEVEDLLIESLLGDEWELAGGRTPDRSVLIGPSGDRWVAVFDTEDEARSDGGETAAKLSGRLGTLAIAVAVADSSDVAVSLWGDGSILDRYARGDWATVDSTDRDESAWGRVLRDDAGIAQLSEIWRADPLLGEEIPRDLAEFVAADPMLLGTGYGYAVEERLVEGFRRIDCCSTKPRSWEDRVSGPPRIVFHGEPSGNSSIRWIGVTPPGTLAHVGARNAGGSWRGLEIVLKGTPIAEGVILPDSTWVWIGSSGATGSFSEYVDLTPHPDDPQVLSVTLSEVDIPAASAAVYNREAMAALSSSEQHRAIEISKTASLGVAVYGRVAKAGSGTMVLSVSPLGYPEGGITNPTEIAVSADQLEPGYWDLLRVEGEPADWDLLLVKVANLDPAIHERAGSDRKDAAATVGAIKQAFMRNEDLYAELVDRLKLQCPDLAAAVGTIREAFEARNRDLYVESVNVLRGRYASVKSICDIADGLVHQYEPIVFGRISPRQS